MRAVVQVVAAEEAEQTNAYITVNKAVWYLVAEEFPASSHVKAVFVMEMETEDFGREVTVCVAVFGPDGPMRESPEYRVTLPDGTPGEPPVYLFTESFDLTVERPLDSELRLLVDGQSVAYATVRYRQSP